MALRLVLLALGLATLLYSVYAISVGKVSCKGGPYHKSSQPGMFWASIAAYFGWTGVCVYFAIFGEVG